jgi:hypothetical protein
VARFLDLQVLAAFVTRPSSPTAINDYGSPITADPAPSDKLQMPTSDVDALQIVRALYSTAPRNVLPRCGGGLENALFAVWSQQWPRLRRSFSFQTSGFVGGAQSSRFSIRLVDDPSRPVPEDTSETNQWEHAVIDDLREPGDFRRFIWRYGSDIQRGRERFRFLAELFVLTRNSALRGEALTGILDNVVRTLPEPSDGRLLKGDIVASREGGLSLLPPVDPLDALDYVLRMPLPATLPLPRLTGFSAVDELWPARAAQVLTVLENALAAAPSIANELAHRVAPHIDALTFFVVSKDRQQARSALVAANPRLIDGPGIEGIPQPQLDGLLRHLPDESDLAGRVLDRLLSLDDASVARTFASRFPSLTAEKIFDAIARELAQAGPGVPHHWMTAIQPTLRAMLPGEILGTVGSTSALAAAAVLLNLDVSAGLSSSPAEWAAALSRSRDNVSGQTRQRLMAYLLALALAKPVPGSEPLFEWAFEPVHADIAVSRLPYEGFNALASYLPALNWWQQWDTCLRLRTAVAEAYVENELDVRSFRRLTKNASLFDEMTHIASYGTRGRAFLNRLRVQ